MPVHACRVLPTCDFYDEMHYSSSTCFYLHETCNKAALLFDPDEVALSYICIAYFSRCRLVLIYFLSWSVKTVHEGRIYQLKLFCDKDYPEKPPSVRFHSRINLTCVNHETGVVTSFCLCVVVVWYLGYLLWFCCGWGHVGWPEEV